MTDKTEWRPTDRSYSTAGPQCPHCGFTITPDESIYYEPRYTEEECQECGTKFKVEVHHSVAWACEPIVVVGERQDSKEG